ncbi:MAG: serine/threonine protein kinase, partial [Planctomycetaceae bacterium]|nr:serine/threonine protein kinase [Planctomycetaceae bacterium]
MSASSEDPAGSGRLQNSELSDTAAPASGEEQSVAPNSIEGLFLHALKLTDAEQQRAFLQKECGDDAERQRRVTALLRAYDDAGSFLETPAIGPRPTDDVSLSFLKPSPKDGVLGTIGPYEVLDVVGRGGMGVVLRAVDPKLNRIVAVKILLPVLAANPNSRRRFLREAQAAAAISHPHVVTIHAVDDSHEDTAGKFVPPYLVMEFVAGQSLQQKLDRVGTLRLTEILRIGRQIAEGLTAAHRQGVIHRDIKPAN